MTAVGAGGPVAQWQSTGVINREDGGSNPSGAFIAESAPSPEPSLPPVPTAMVAAAGGLSPGSGQPGETRAEPAVSTPGKLPISPDVEQWRGMVESIFPAFAVETALRIMRCESSGNPNATGAAGEMGLFQIHPRFHPDATYDPYGNMLAAYRISGGGTSWGAWSCR
jgi:hypothetical protein